MASAAVQASGRSRVVVLTVGLLLAGMGALGFAQDPPKSTVPNAETKKTPAGTAGLRGETREVVHAMNDHLAARWKAGKVTPSARASDYEFIRRACLDILGRIPKPAELQQYLKDPTETRHNLLIERLLGKDYQEEYARNWATIWTVWLLTRSGALEPARKEYHEQMRLWLQDQFAKDRSFKEVVTDLLTAAGKTTENGAVNFVLAHLGEPIPASKQSEEGQFEMVPLTSRTTRLFLGLQTQCVQCHDHPFNAEWKQHHFWGVNAFFRQVERKGRPPAPRETTATVMELVDNTTFNPEAAVYYETRKGLLLQTKAVFVENARRPTPSGNRRQELARFITESEYFAKEYVNRIWGHFFGRGLNEQPSVDDFGEHNKVEHPELLNELAKQFVHYGYQPSRLIRWICNSEAYQLSSLANKTNEKPEQDKLFSRMLLKAMTPEQLFESLMVATQADVAETAETRKKLREQWMRNLIVNFGDDEGNEVTFNGTVVQALLLMNGKEINDAIGQLNKGTVVQVLRKRGTSQSVLHDLYLAALSRPPTNSESVKIRRILDTAPVKKLDPVAPWQDLFWALLNSNEFLLNH